MMLGVTRLRHRLSHGVMRMNDGGRLLIGSPSVGLHQLDYSSDFDGYDGYYSPSLASWFSLQPSSVQFSSVVKMVW